MHHTQAPVLPAIKSSVSCCDAVIGCGTSPAPAGGWLRRHGDKMTLGCNDTAGMTWTLMCVDSQWTGVAYNCTIQGIHFTSQDISLAVSYHVVQNLISFV